MKQNRELSIIQKSYDLIAWFIPTLEKLPRSHKYTLGERLQLGLYDLLEGLVQARYSPEKVTSLERLNGRLEVIRYQVRLLVEFGLMDSRRYEHASRLINDVGVELGGWLKQQREKRRETNE